MLNENATNRLKELYRRKKRINKKLSSQPTTPKRQTSLNESLEAVETEIENMKFAVNARFQAIEMAISQEGPASPIEEPIAVSG